MTHAVPAAGIGSTGGRPAHHLQETRMTDTTDPQTERPFADEPTEVLHAALDLASVHARQAARFSPPHQDDALPAVVGIFRNELQHRGEL